MNKNINFLLYKYIIIFEFYFWCIQGLFYWNFYWLYGLKMKRKVVKAIAGSQERITQIKG